MTRQELREFILSEFKKYKGKGDNPCWPGHSPGGGDPSEPKTKIGKSGKRVANCKKNEADEVSEEQLDETIGEGKMRISKKQLLQIIHEEVKSTKKYDDSKHLKGDQDELPDALQKGIIDKAKKSKKEVDEADRVEEAEKMPAGYKAKKDTKRGDKLRALTQRYKNAKTEKQKAAARKARDNYEAEIADKNTYGKPKKSQYSEGVDMDEETLKEFVEAVLLDEKKKRKKPRKITKKVDAALKKKAKKHNAPVGALKAVYRKGMGAFYTSGSRPGQNPHSWAMGRVNSFLKGGKARKIDSAQWNQVKKHRKK